MPTLTYTSNGTFDATASFTSASISCWGAGGSGNSNGQGGSGGAYAFNLVIVPSGSYQIYVGQSNYDGFGNGGDSYFLSASIIRVRAAGGKSDGTISHQSSLNTGSLKYVGGAGGTLYSTEYNGSGGGAAAGGTSAGNAGGNNLGGGASFEQTGHSATGSIGGDGSVSGGGSGGDGAYYKSTTNSGLIVGTAGTSPGGGGGGGYSAETNVLDTTGIGGVGRVTVSY